ncbi:hypothetical protein RO3G_02561 [Rhizopus delemar RA 99-880]|uniref:Transcription elongation factor 1 homolog n=1 Tax=Rhizopus delemar (strain RA 99-880 / ATCC MYA-4621 / FGSC 9543 / NRRL 43880) TaxID=246409 RepID=I1BNS7_RHIO9|nr:hypothetical protein RO3G_02561 [Rhizopus delemar RA 99-880]|eukprot:EIE77857.1 hypothetical protein RO3G_02561 [Rhizopus delemar RA 99-880]
MGKRKTKRKPQKKLKDKLDTQFNCVFCNHENSVDCKIDNANKLGHLNYLDEPVDVYSAWIDACEDVNRRKRLERSKNLGRDEPRSPAAGSYDEEED